MKELSREEALARLATLYFQSHSPATLSDFVWWSGLAATEARHAVALIETDLLTENVWFGTFYLHVTCERWTLLPESVASVPSYDEYLISYKDRTTVMLREHHHKAFNTFGIFYPVILYEPDRWQLEKRFEEESSYCRNFFVRWISRSPGRFAEKGSRLLLLFPRSKVGIPHLIVVILHTFPNPLHTSQFLLYYYVLFLLVCISVVCFKIYLYFYFWHVLCYLFVRIRYYPSRDIVFWLDIWLEKAYRF